MNEAETVTGKCGHLESVDVEIRANVLRCRGRSWSSRQMMSSQDPSNLHNLAIFLRTSRCLEPEWKSKFWLTYNPCAEVCVRLSMVSNASSILVPDDIGMMSYTEVRSSEQYLDS
jgi:hypothetical protein